VLQGREIEVRGEEGDDMVYSSPMARLDQFAGISSLLGLSSSPVIGKEYFRTSLVRTPSGWSADLLAMKR